MRDAAARIVAEARGSAAAVVFGAERTGLTNEELEAAHVLLRIPASEVYPSLNLAMAVQLVAYEIFRARARPLRRLIPRGVRRSPPPRRCSELYAHLAQVLQEIDFKRPHRERHAPHEPHPPLLQRAELDQNEVNILRGILTAVQNRRRHAGAAPPMSVATARLSRLRRDHAGRSAVAAAMDSCLTEGGDFGNASSSHAFGRAAALRIERARAQVAALIGADAGRDHLHVRRHRVEQPVRSSAWRAPTPTAAGTS